MKKWGRVNRREQGVLGAVIVVWTRAVNATSLDADDSFGCSHPAVSWPDLPISGLARCARSVRWAGSAAGGELLRDPARYAGAAILYGTLPFDAGIATPSGRLTGCHVFVAHGENDQMITPELLDRARRYLVLDSGATTRAVRYPDSHGLSERVIADLSAWISEVAVEHTP
jgi:phospholipase/carboxylesterase